MGKNQYDPFVSLHCCILVPRIGVSMICHVIRLTLTAIIHFEYLSVCP